MGCLVYRQFLYNKLQTWTSPNSTVLTSGMVVGWCTSIMSLCSLASSGQQQNCEKRLQRRKLTLVEVGETPKLVHEPEIVNIDQGGTYYAKLTPIWYSFKKMDS